MYGLRLLSESIPAVSNKIYSRKYITLGRVVTYWPQIVGEELARKVHPTRLIYRGKTSKGSAGQSSANKSSRSKSQKKPQQKKAQFTLEIACSTAEATILRYRIDLILERINQVFGEDFITDLRFVPTQNAPLSAKSVKKARKPLTYKEKEFLSKNLESVEDPEIQEKLKKLGAAILQDRNT